MENVINFDLLKEYDGTLKEVLKVWQKQKSYSVGDTIQYKGNYLKCTTAGTSGTITLNFTGLDIGDTINDGTVVWEIIEPPSAGVDLPEWQPNTLYTAGKYLVYEGTVYKVDNDFTSGTTFSDTNLTAYIAPIMQGATSSADGKAGMVIKPTTTDVDKFLKGDGTWGSAGGGISIWQANTAYNVNDVVIDSNLIWQCATAHTSTTTFDESKWVCISGGEISNGLEIVDLWSGTFSFDNSTQGSEPTSSTPTIELSDSIQNYEYLLVGCGLLVNNVVNNQDSIITPTSILSSGGNLRVSIVIADSEVYSAVLAKYDNTHLYMRWKAKTYGDDANIISVQGIRKAKPIVSSGMKYETLWEGEAGTFSSTSETGTITLSKSYLDYKKIGFWLVVQDSNLLAHYYKEVDSSMLSNLNSNHISFVWGYSSNSDYVEINAPSSSTVLNLKFKETKVLKVVGISEGVQIPTGVQAARVTLWEGNYGSEGSSVELSDSINNYDQLIFTINGGVYSTEDNYVDNIINIDDNTYNKVSFRLFCGWQDEGASFNIKFTDATHFTIVHKNASSWATGSAITRVVGIKYIQPDSYSTTEKLIGTWIDGKPLYRQVFTNAGNNYDTGLTNSTYEIKKVYGSAVTSTATYNVPNETDYLTVTHTGLIETNRQSALNWVAVEYTKN